MNGRYPLPEIFSKISVVAIPFVGFECLQSGHVILRFEDEAVLDRFTVLPYLVLVV